MRAGSLPDVGSIADKHLSRWSRSSLTVCLRVFHENASVASKAQSAVLYAAHFPELVSTTMVTKLNSRDKTA
jgi:hypothetical protein